jgi:polyether ionophore transport system permease protein
MTHVMWVRSGVWPTKSVPVFGRTGRKALRSGLLWGALFGVVVASSALSYTRIYTTQAERDALATAFGANHATAALFGPAPELQTVAGFVVFKSFMTIIVLGALWGLLTSTRLLRGEEDAGRWDLMLCGRVTSRGATLQALAALGLGALGLWTVTALFTVGTGHSAKVGLAVAPGLYFALAQASPAVMFLGVGALTSQLAPTRRQAAALASWFLGASYLLRMVADAGVGLHAIVWLTPLGWVEELQPLTSPDPVALLPILGLTVLTASCAVFLSGRRDAGDGTMPDRDHAPARLGLLSGQFTLSVRLTRSTITAWLCAIGVTGVVLGLVAKQAGDTITGSSVQEVFTRLGATGTGAAAFLGVSFLIVAVLLAFLAAGQTTAARGEEVDGRVSNLVVARPSRASWLGGRIALGLGVVLAAGILAGFGVWVGAAAEGAGVGLATLLDAGANIAAPAFCLLGIGFLALGARPRWTSFVVYGVLGWSLVVELVGGFGTSSRWLLDTSLFHQMSAAPAVSPDWRTNAVLAGIGLLGALFGLICFRRRDLAGA